MVEIQRGLYIVSVLTQSVVISRIYVRSIAMPSNNNVTCVAPERARLERQTDSEAELSACLSENVFSLGLKIGRESVTA